MCRKIWCDGESWKILDFRWDLNRASVYKTITTRQHHTSITTRETCDLGEHEHVADERVMHAWSKDSVGLVGCWSGVRVRCKLCYRSHVTRWCPGFHGFSHLPDLPTAKHAVHAFSLAAPWSFYWYCDFVFFAWLVLLYVRHTYVDVKRWISVFLCSQKVVLTLNKRAFIDV